MANSVAALRYPQVWKSGRELAECRAEPRYPPLQLSAYHSLLSKGLSRGALVEVLGRRSSGRSSFTHSVLAEATGRGEICAVVDLFGSFSPECAAAAGVELDRLVWVRCQGNAEHAMQATDLLLHAGGFGVLVLDLCEANARMLNRIPVSHWYRFRRAVENTMTILVVCGDRAQVKAAAAHTFTLEQPSGEWRGTRPALLLGLHTRVTHRAAGMPPQSGAVQAVA